jgi:hypothetical protein
MIGRSSSRALALLSDSEVCATVLSYSTAGDKPNHITDLDTQNFFAGIRFPAFPLWEIKSMASEIEQGQSLGQVLKKHSFSFPLAPDRIPHLLTKVEKSSISFTALFVLYTFFSWTTTVQTQGADLSIIEMLESLARVCDKANFSTLRQLRESAVTAFFSLYSRALESAWNIPIQRFVGCLVSVFECAGELPAVFDDLLYSTVVWLDRQPPDVQLQSAALFTFLSKYKSSASFSKILEVLLMSLGKVSSELYNFLGIFADRLAHDTVQLQIVAIPRALYHMLGTEPVVNRVVFETREFTELPDSRSAEVALHFHPGDTFQHGVDTQVVEFPKPVLLSVMLPERIVARLTVLAQTSGTSNVLARAVLLSMLDTLKMQRDRSHYFDFVASFFYVFSLFPNSSIGDLPLDRLFNTVLFDPQVTVFDPCDGFDRLSALRDRALHVFSSTNANLCEEVLEWSRCYPLLFTEILHRFVHHTEILPSSQDRLLDFGRSLMSIALFYQSFAQEKLPDVDTARTGIYS